MIRAIFLALTLAAPAVAQDIDRGARLFVPSCAVWHGAAATGMAPMAEILIRAPSDLTAIAARRDGAFPMFEIARAIDGRGPLLVHGGEMPIFGFVFGG
ncbi:MAG: cytochrome c [Pseudomonadota bacterium]